jgi:chemotaxis protein MotB
MNKNREVPIRIIVRKKGHGGAHGGAWKVALADFMTAMFSLFLVLWLVNQSSDVKSAIAGYFQDPLGRASESGSSILKGDGAQTMAPSRPLSQSDVMSLRRDRLRKTADELKKRVQETPNLSTIRGYIDIKLTEDGLRIELLEDSTGIFFETGRPVPSPRGEQALAILGSELAALPNCLKIEGHTDAWPYHGSPSYTNWELSADRANAARRIMTEHGLRYSQVSAITGLAEREPRDPHDAYAPANRRITITVLLDKETGADSASAPRDRS